ncbi:MAG: pyridoxal phosphate-dependent aminotransferase [Prevotellaceae bacterium]|jgi:aspartate/methionine/tyrosine aminotransferase|nr:pyridoxal phosphate-dependent aminotransferase [Prevotellaceae bacterium]
MNPQMSKLKPFIVMDVLEKANDMQQHGTDIIHLEVGEPDFNMPACAVEAAQKALAEGKTHYTHSLGEPELRRTIADFYKTEYGVTVDPDCIVISSGSSPAILMVIMLLCEVGGEVMYSNPGYACYRNFILSCNGVPVEIPLTAENGFQYDIEEIKKRITPKTRAIFINSPMNPTGMLMDKSVMQELAALGIPVISDEIYHGLVYEGKAHSMLEFSDEAFILNGFSKRFAMTGLRLGYLIAPKKYMRTLQTLQQNLFICAPSMVQHAGIAALKYGNEDVEKMRAVYNERRLYMIKRLKAMGFILHSEPQGAFYVFADARMFTNDVYKFSFEVLEKAHVGITPGVDFGTNGEGFVRFSYANSLDNIREGMDRLERYLQGKSK